MSGHLDVASTGGRPSPAVAGIGIDAVEVERFRDVLARRERLAERLFTPVELDRARCRRDPVPSLAARFAAKEAVMKALGVGIGAVDWHDMEVGAAASGAPQLRLRGRAAALAAAVGATAWHVSLTHTASMAMATVVVERAGADVPR